jgi:hypothetical protein
LRPVARGRCPGFVPTAVTNRVAALATPTAAVYSRRMTHCGENT